MSEELAGPILLTFLGCQQQEGNDNPTKEHRPLAIVKSSKFRNSKIVSTEIGSGNDLQLATSSSTAAAETVGQVRMLQNFF
jgi:hypothetical protein